jgi:predicted HD phosphohydrolase
MTVGPERPTVLLLSLLRELKQADSPFPFDELAHSLQTATRAERAGADDDLVFAALCHDVGKAFRTQRGLGHGALAAEIIRPYVRPEVAWVVRVHEDFTAWHFSGGRRRYRRFRHRLHPGYAMAARFVDEWDFPARDPEYDTRPLEHFEPLVRRMLEHATVHGPDDG